MQYPFQTEELKEEEESFDKVELSEEVELLVAEEVSSLSTGVMSSIISTQLRPTDIHTQRSTYLEEENFILKAIEQKVHTS